MAKKSIIDDIMNSRKMRKLSRELMRQFGKVKNKPGEHTFVIDFVAETVKLKRRTKKERGKSQ